MNVERALPPVARRPEEVAWESLGLDGEAAVRTVIGTRDSRTLGAGLGRFRDIEFEWELGYDEVIYVLSGGVEVKHAGGVERGGPGDILFVPSGNTVTYRFAGDCEVFFATYPVDWEERTGA